MSAGLPLDSGRGKLGGGPLRIAHVQPMTLDLFGHADHDFGTKATYFLSNLAAAQARLGHLPTVHLLTSSRPSVLRVDRVDVHFHRCVQPPTRMGGHVRFARQLSLQMVHAIQEGSADLVHFHGLRNCHLMLGAIACRTSRQSLPLVAQDQGTRDGGPLESRVHRYALRRLSAALAANAESVTVLTEEGVRPEKLHLVPNGFDPEVFGPAASAPRPPGSSLNILVVSRLTPEKDPLTMARGIRAFAHAGGRAAVTVIGQGSLLPQVEESLRGSAATLRFLHCHLPQRTLADYFRAADVLVMTSLGEGSNQVVLEAMACGLPVIASDVPGIRDVVDGAGTLVSARDPAALASALRRLAETPELRDRQRELGLARAKAFTWSAIACRLDPIYAECLRESTRWRE